MYNTYYFCTVYVLSTVRHICFAVSPHFSIHVASLFLHAFLVLYCTSFLLCSCSIIVLYVVPGGTNLKGKVVLQWLLVKFLSETTCKSLVD